MIQEITTICYREAVNFEKIDNSSLSEIKKYNRNHILLLAQGDQDAR